LKYIIYADEAWTHSQPLYRYHRFFGGILSSENSFDDLECEVKKLKKQHNYKKEIKWSNLSARDISFYTELLELVGTFLCKEDHTKYRQMFMDRSYQYTGVNAPDLDSQFKIYYQFLKHIFGLEFSDANSEFLFKLDNHSSYLHKERLREFISSISNDRVKISIEFIESKTSIPLQICDLLMGAAGYYGNKVDWDLLPGKRRRSKNQIMKSEFGKGVYNLLRNIDAMFRGRKAFNWFETTGVDGCISNRYHHKMRIWKFIPNGHEKDVSWEDDAFGKNTVRKK